MTQTPLPEKYERDMITEILDTNPNIPATQGVFRSSSARFDRLDQRLDRMEQDVAKLSRSVDLIAVTVNEILLRLPPR